MQSANDIADSDLRLAESVSRADRREELSGFRRNRIELENFDEVPLGLEILTNCESGAIFPNELRLQRIKF